MKDKEHLKALAQAWRLQSKILKDIQRLARMNEALAYGCVRTGETLIDVMLVDRLRSTKQEESESLEQEV